MLEILSFSVCKLWQKRQLHINTDSEVTGWMLCVIPHICKNAKYHSDSDHRKQFSNVIKTLFCGLYEYEIAFTQDLFYTEHTYFDKKNCSFDGDEFICKRKYIIYGSSHLQHQKNLFL